MKGSASPLAMWCTSAQGSSQARIQMAPVALWDLSTVLLPPFGAGRSHASAESAPQKFSHYFGRFQAWGPKMVVNRQRVMKAN